MAGVIDDVSGRWDVKALQSLLGPENVNKVTRMTLPQARNEHNKGWAYTINSGYSLAASLVFDPELEVQGN